MLQHPKRPIYAVGCPIKTSHSTLSDKNSPPRLQASGSSCTGPSPWFKVWVRGRRTSTIQMGIFSMRQESMRQETIRQDGVLGGRSNTRQAIALPLKVSQLSYLMDVPYPHYLLNIGRSRHIFAHAATSFDQV